MYTPVTEDQFEITDDGIKHVPTGCEFVPYPGQPLSGNKHIGYLGTKLPTGEDYDPNAVEQMMRSLWSEYVSKRKLLGG
jgi:hypothetical protein